MAIPGWNPTSEKKTLGDKAQAHRRATMASLYPHHPYAPMPGYPVPAYYPSPDPTSPYARAYFPPGVHGGIQDSPRESSNRSSKDYTSHLTNPFSMRDGKTPNYSRWWPTHFSEVCPFSEKNLLCSWVVEEIYNFFHSPFGFWTFFLGELENFDFPKSWWDLHILSSQFQTSKENFLALCKN